MASKVDKIIARFDVLKNNKQSLRKIYELISEYVYNRKFDSYDIPNGGIFTDEDVFDNTALRSNSIMSNVMVNNIWPNGPRTFTIDRTWDTPDTAEVKKYFEFVNSQMYSVMDNTRAGFQTAFDEYMEDQGSFGVSGIYVEEKAEDKTVPVRYKPWNVKTMYIDEGPDGLIDTIFSELSISIRNAVKIYGYDKLSEKVRKDFDNGKYEEKIKILHVIEPRIDRNTKKKGAKDMPIASVHIELSCKRIIKESGIEEMPIFVGRFFKVPGEIYGRSPAMVAMPDILELNAVREALTIATEKQLDPPLAVYDDGALGGGNVDTSAGAINVFSVTGRLNAGKPIEPLYTVGELQSSYAHIETLTESIKNHFYLDRLLDFNNETRMTLGEAQLRNALRGQSLGAFYARQINEVVTPIIQRTFNILMKNGKLGVTQGSKEEKELLKINAQPMYIPDCILEKIAKGEDIYEITYLSPAKRTMQSEELQGIIETASFACQVAPVDVDIVDNIDFDKLISRIAKLSGAPMDLIRDSKTIKDIRSAKAKQQTEALELEKARQQSEIGRNIAQMNAMQGDNV